MRAALFHEAGRPLTIETVPDPEPGPGEVVIEVRHCGICGSDLHLTQYPGLVPAGTILGHEFAGSVVATGSGVSGWRAGDRVTALPLASCESCEFCRQGLPALCSSHLFTGCGQAPGAYARYVTARGSMLQRLPTGVDFDEGALVEPLAVAFHAVDMAELRPGSDVLVLGAGPIGVGVAMFARLAGARRVVVSEFAADRRQRALDVGATDAVDPRAENVAQRVAEIAGGPPQVVFECVGMPGLLAQAMELVKIRGKVVVAGVCFEKDGIMPVVGITKELTVQFSECYTPRDFELVADLIAQGRAPARRLITQTVGLDALPAAFEGLRQPSTQCKILIDPAA